MDVKGNTTRSSQNTGDYMLFSYWIFIIIFLGLVGNVFVLVIFNKALKGRSTSPCYQTLSISALVSTVSYIVSYANSVRQNDTRRYELHLCKVTVFLEVSGDVVHIVMCAVIMCHSWIKTFSQMTSSTFYQQRLTKFTIAAQACVWISGILFGAIPAWIWKDVVISEDRFSCTLRWTHSDGIFWYRLQLDVMWVYVPGIVALTAFIVTRR